MRVVSSAEVRPENGRLGINYIGRGGTMYVGQQAFLVRMPNAGARVNPHFHDVDQFQVVVGGDGTLGKHEVAPISFHYADAYTPYGPIIAKEDGISFFTLRLMPAGGVFAMPGHRDRMKRKAGRNMAGRLQFEDSDDGLVVKQLLQPEPDGMHAVGIRLAPGMRARSIASDGGGQYLVVASGSLVCDGKALPKLSLIFVEPSEAAPVLHAGPDGAEVLVLQYPRPTDRLGSDPAELAKRTEPYYRSEVVV
jgi:hypothetical protein